MLNGRIWSAVALTGSWGAMVLSAHTIINAALVRRPSLDPPPTDRMVSVCIPARNEEANIRACLDAVSASVGTPRIEVLVLDDGSTDHTAEIVRAVVGEDPRVSLLPGTDLPAGWLGKPFACSQLSAIAQGDVFVFLDADVRISRHAIASAVELMDQHGLSLVSPYPKQLVGSFAERLVQPLLQWLWLTFVPLRLSEATRPISLTAANGQFMVIDRNAYNAAGGHDAVRNHVIDDVWLARAVKRSGNRTAVVDGTDIATCRMYTGWPTVRDGYTKSLWAAFGSPLAAFGVGALLCLCYIVPPLAMVRGARRAGTFGTISAIVSRVVAARRTGGLAFDAWMHPGSVAALLYLLLLSELGHRKGTLVWKGRKVR